MVLLLSLAVAFVSVGVVVVVLIAFVTVNHATAITLITITCCFFKYRITSDQQISKQTKYPTDLGTNSIALLYLKKTRFVDKTIFIQLPVCM